MATLFRLICIVATVTAFSGCNRASARSQAILPIPSAATHGSSLTASDRAIVDEIKRLGAKVTVLTPADSEEPRMLISCAMDPRENPLHFIATEESGPKITVQVRGETNRRKVLAELARIGAWQRLELLDGSVDDTDLRAIARLPGVEQLHLDAKNASAAAIARLAKMPGLRVLELVNATDAAVTKELARFPSHVLIVKLDESNATFFDLYTEPATPPKIDHD